jgi:hypothetical protein
VHDALVHNWTRPGGWRDQLAACADSLDTPNPNNTLCAAIEETLEETCLGSFFSSRMSTSFPLHHLPSTPLLPQNRSLTTLALHSTSHDMPDHELTSITQ